MWHVELPNSMVSIKERLFEDCFTCESEIVIPEGVKSIGKNAFKGCKGLNTITLPYSLETIGSNAFSDCVNLKKILPDGYGSFDLIERLKNGNLKLKDGLVIGSYSDENQ